MNKEQAIAVVRNSSLKTKFLSTARKEKNSISMSAFTRCGKVLELYCSDSTLSRSEALKTIFPIASMTKVFTACCILKLRDEGKLVLESSPNKYISLDKTWDNISLKNLLCMTSGLAYDNPWGDRLLYLDNLQINKTLKNGFYFSHEFTLSFEYSNLSYIILGSVIESVTKNSFTNYLNDFLLKPLELIDTKWLNIEENTIKGFAGAFGGLCSTLSDLSIFMDFMQSAFRKSSPSYDSILSKTSRIEIQTPYTQYAQTRSLGYSALERHYGYGIVITSSYSGELLGHSGGLPGYGSHFRWSKNSDLGIVSLTNETYATYSKECGELLDEACFYNDFYFNNEPSKEAKEIGKRLFTFLLNPKDILLDELFSSNFFLDNDKDVFMARIGALNLSNRNKDDYFILPETESGGLLVVGQVAIFFSLNPEITPKIQSVIFV